MNFNKKVVTLSALALLLLSFAGAPGAEVVERIVAVVGSDVITLYDLESAMAPYAGDIKNSPNREAKYKTVKMEVLEKLIDTRLLKQAIESAKINVTTDELARYIRGMLYQNHTSLEALKAELAKKGISYESYKEDVKKTLEQYKFMNQVIGPRVKISDQDLKDYFVKHLDEFGGKASVNIAQIILPFDETTTKDSAMAMKTKAEEISRLAKTGTSFSALAKQYSKGPNAEGGGDLGIVDPKLLLPEVAQAIETMNVGQVSNPVVSSAGIHIIYLKDRAKATEKDFEKVKESVYNKMYDIRAQEEMNQYLSEQRRKTYIEVR